MKMHGPNNDTDYATLSQFYDLEYDAFDADIELYRQFALRADGPILELGCGTGRVLREMTGLGYPLTGIDVSHAMLALAKLRVDDSVDLIYRDMRTMDADPPLPHQPYALVFSAINTFLHLDSVESQMEALGSIRRVTDDDGLLILDLMLPDPRYLATIDGQLNLEFRCDLENGALLDKWVARSHSLDRQVIETTVYFDLTARDGNLKRYIDHYITRYIHVYELEHLLARTGWDLISLYGDYDLEPFGPDAERMIALATPSTTQEQERGKQ